MAAFRHMAVNLIRTAGKDSFRTRRKAAGWVQGFLRTATT